MPMKTTLRTRLRGPVVGKVGSVFTAEGGQLADAGDAADGGDSEAFAGEGEAAAVHEDAAGVDDVVVVVEGLTHTHEDDVADATARAGEWKGGLGIVGG